MQTLIVSVLFFLATTNQAAVRTFVSALNGSDSNNCSRTAPCRTFGVAMTFTDLDGELVVLDSGGYSPFTISQGITLIAPASVHAAIAPTSGSGIVVNAPGAYVKIRGLALNGLGGVDGLEVDNVGSLHLEDVAVTGFADNGLQFDGAGHLFIGHSTFRANSGNGVRIVPSGATTAVLADSVFERNGGAGYHSGANVRATIVRSISAQNSHGYSCSGGIMNLESSVASVTGFNISGLIASSGCIARVSNSTISGGSNCLQNSGNSATIQTRSNNTLVDCTDVYTGTVTTLSGQ